MRRGSVSERYVKCSKLGCACATDTQARHGPYFSLTNASRGRTHSRFLNVQQAATARAQIEAGREFRRQVDAYWKICEQWADEELEGVAAASGEAVKKGGSRRASRPRSRKRSKP